MYSSFAKRCTVYSTSPFTSSEPLATYAISKYLLLGFVALDLLLLGVGIAFVALSLAWMNANPIHSMVLTEGDLFAGFGLGSLFIATFLFSLPALLHSLSLSSRREFSSTTLSVLNIILCIDQLAVIVTGVIVWWRTLQERNTFFKVWQSSTPAFQSDLETKFDCCGYFTPCQGSPGIPVCVDPITRYADKILNILFTSMFATSAIIVLFLLCSGCITAELKILNRYRKIDIKRGKLSFA